MTIDPMHEGDIIVRQGPNITYPSRSAAQHVREVVRELVLKAQPFEYLQTMRENGWALAVHNDYWQDGVRYTLYLFTHRHYGWVKGESVTDLLAILQALGDSHVARDLYHRQHPNE